jgi:hypothetical protein
VLSFDGKILHENKGLEPVRFLDSPEMFLFNWSRNMWLHDPDTSVMTDYCIVPASEKRKREEEDNVEQDLAVLRGHLLRSRNNDPPAPPTG